MRLRTWNRYLGWLATKLSERSRTSVNLKRLFPFLREYDSREIRNPIYPAISPFGALLLFPVAIVLGLQEDVNIDIGYLLFVPVLFAIFFVETPFAFQQAGTQTSGTWKWVRAIVPAWLLWIGFSTFVFGGLNELIPWPIANWIIAALTFLGMNTIILSVRPGTL